MTRQFLRNFGGDQVRFLARGFTVAGDRGGQQSSGHRYPYGPVAIIAPFNFPLEIPVLQLMGALYMGNKVVIKSAEKTAMVLEQWYARRGGARCSACNAQLAASLNRAPLSGFVSCTIAARR